MLHESVFLLYLTLFPLVLASHLTSPRPPDLNITVTDTARPQCIDDLAFLTAEFNPDHCWKAVKRLIDEYAWPEGQTRYEFLPPHDWVLGETDLHKRRTAQKWDYGTCVATILTASAFMPGEFPFASWMTPVTDVGTYGQAAHWAEFTARACITTEFPVHYSDGLGGVTNKTSANSTNYEIAAETTLTEISRRTTDSTSKKKRWRERVGYTITGENHGVGVFIWAKGSQMDTRFENHIPD